MPKAILFDLDGVLVDAAPWHREAFCTAVLMITGYTLTPEEHRRDLEGRPTRVKLARLVAQRKIYPEDVERIAARKQELTQTLIEERCRPEPQRVALLTWAARQWPLGCVTNCTRSNAEALLSASGLLASLSLVLTNEDVPFPKPDPLAYAQACARLRLPPSEVLVVEDHPVGVEAAEKAGCPVWHLESYRALTQEALTTWMAAAPSS